MPSKALLCIAISRLDEHFQHEEICASCAFSSKCIYYTLVGEGQIKDVREMAGKAKVRELHAVAASEFAHNFGRYKMEAQHQAVPVSSHGSVVGYFVSAREYEQLLELKAKRRVVLKTADLSPEEA